MTVSTGEANALRKKSVGLTPQRQQVADLHPDS
jgi:hypothetical protein